MRLNAVARCFAESEEEARQLIEFDCIDLGYDDGDARLTEASIDTETHTPHLFEVDGEMREVIYGR